MAIRSWNKPRGRAVWRPCRAPREVSRLALALSVGTFLGLFYASLCWAVGRWSEGPSEYLRRFGIVGTVAGIAALDPPTAITMEGRAARAVDKVLRRDGYTLRSVRCFRDAHGWPYCAVCADHPKHYLGATLVRCTLDECEWPLDVAEWEKLNWNGEEECAKR